MTSWLIVKVRPCPGLYCPLMPLIVLYCPLFLNCPLLHPTELLAWLHCPVLDCTGLLLTLFREIFMFPCHFNVSVAKS